VRARRPARNVGGNKDFRDSERSNIVASAGRSFSSQQSNRRGSKRHACCLIRRMTGWRPRPTGLSALASFARSSRRCHCGLCESTNGQREGVDADKGRVDFSVRKRESSSERIDLTAQRNRKTNVVGVYTNNEGKICTPLPRNLDL